MQNSSVYDRSMELFVGAEDQLTETAETVANDNSRGGTAMSGDGLTVATKISNGTAGTKSEVSATSIVAVDQMDASEGVTDMSCDIDSDFFDDNVNRTFTLTSPFVTSAACKQEPHTDGVITSLMLADNQQQVESIMPTLSTASEQQAPANHLMTSAVNQQQAASVVSAAYNQQTPSSGSTASVTSRHTLPVTLSNSPSCFSSGIY